MKFLKNLLTVKNKNASANSSGKMEVGEDSTSTSCAGSSDTRSGKGGPHKRKKKESKKKESKSPAEDPAAKGIERAKSLVESWRTTTPVSVEKSLEEYSSDKVQVCFEDVPPITSRQLIEIALHVIRPSFPDMDFTYSSIRPVGGDPKVLCVDELVCTATHTGIPYSIPGTPFPPIAATGTRCVNDPERVILYLDDSEECKIQKMEFIALGNTTGLMGLYEQVKAGATAQGK